MNMTGELFTYDTRGYPEFCAGAKKVGTSEQAAREITPTLKAAHKLILDAVHSFGPATADEIAERIGKSVLYTRPRCAEMVALGLLFDTDTTRKNASQKSATVWCA